MPHPITGGKILTYHSEAYFGDQESVSVTSSTKTPKAGNGIHIRVQEALGQNALFKGTKRCTSSRIIKPLSLLTLMAFIVGGGLSWFAIDSNNGYAGGLQTTVAKARGVNDNAMLQQRMMDAEVAARGASASHVAFWEPRLANPGTSATVLAENSMAVMSQCFGRSIYNFHMEDSGAYQMHPVQNFPQTTTTQVVFTPDFQGAAMEIFDHFNPGAFFLIVHDPVDIYLEQYKKQNGSGDIDNLLVRHLSGVAEDRTVNDGDFEVAKQMLGSKFVIGSCNDPTETLRRLMKMMGDSSSPDQVSMIANDRCATERQSWNQACRIMKETVQQSRDAGPNQRLVRTIRSKHKYDILLYEASKNMFQQQSVLFQ